MKDDQPKKKKPLSREEWLALAGKRGAVDPDEYDEFSRDAIKGLPYAGGEASLRDALHALDRRLDRLTAPAGSGEPRRRRRLSPLLLKAAAVTALALATAAYFFFDAGSSPARDLYAVYFEPVGSAIPNTGLRKTAPPQTDEEKAWALQYYEQQAYGPAIEHFVAHLSRHPGDAEARFYYGIALMGAGRWPEAAPQLEQVLHTASREPYRTGSRWYLALTDLQEGRLAATKAQLEELVRQSDERSSYRRQALRLLADLEDLQ